MKKILWQNLAFIIPYLLFLLTAGIFLIVFPKGEVHLAINQFRFRFCDYFFYYATFLGDFIVVIVLALLLCLISYRFALLIALSNIFSSLIVQLLKHTLFSYVVRPKKFFEGAHDLNLVPGYENYIHNSFPSGHSTTAFTIFFCLALILKNKTLKFLMFVIAFTVGFSRVYLSQHFLNDVYAGSLIGVAIALLTYGYLFSDRMSAIHWLDKSFLKNK